MSEVYPKFGKLTVISYTKTGRRGGKFTCKCDCGNIIELPRSQIVYGNNKSCGCLRKIDIIGKKFTKLLVIRTFTKNKRTWCTCKCDCGNDTSVCMSQLLNKHTQSCGCFKPNRKKYGESAKNARIASYKRGAKDRNLLFELTDEYIEKLMLSKCYYCNIEPSRIVHNQRQYGEFICNGIDRKNPDIGYTKENCVTCCTKCNFMKGRLLFDDFLNQVKAIYNNLCN